MIRFPLLLMMVAIALEVPWVVAQAPASQGASVLRDPVNEFHAGNTVLDEHFLLDEALIESGVWHEDPTPIPDFGLFESMPSTSVGAACDEGGGRLCRCVDSCSCGHPGVASDWTPWQGVHRRLAKHDLDRFWRSRRAGRQPMRDRGIGYERVMYAPNILDTAITIPHIGFRYQIDRGLNRPDRLEYYWGNEASMAGGGAETRVNAQDLSVRLAFGNEKAMAITEYTLRSLDPRMRENTTGMGDMVVGAQAMLVDAQRVKIATIFRTYLATGPSDRGLGTGHTSLEPGVLGRLCLSPKTYLFSEFKYWMPIAGTSDVSGDVMSTGWGISTIAMESDVFALMPTFEVKTLTFLFGGQTNPNTSPASIERIDGLTAVELYPGARCVLGSASGVGLWEFGFAGGVTVADDDWFDTRLVFDLRLSF